MDIDSVLITAIATLSSVSALNVLVAAVYARLKNRRGQHKAVTITVTGTSGSQGVTLSGEELKDLSPEELAKIVKSASEELQERSSPRGDSEDHTPDRPHGSEK